MPKGASSSGSSQNVARGGGSSGPRAAPRPSPAAGNTGPRRRTGTRSSGPSKSNANENGVLRFYTNDAPGIKVSPLVVLAMSLCFIGFVTFLHIMGKVLKK